MLEWDGRMWKHISIPRKLLNLDVILPAGQTFRFKKTGEAWFGTARGIVWELLQKDDMLLYRVLAKFANNIDVPQPKRSKAKRPKTVSENLGNDLPDAEAILHDLFRLDVDLEPLYKRWSLEDPVFAGMAERLPGIRILRQDPVENLFSFICSSNNHIGRISGMVARMCRAFGEGVAAQSVDPDAVEASGLVGDSDAEGSPPEEPYYDFPTVERLCAEDVEAKLRDLGFGYRAKYISQAARQIRDLGGRDWLLKQRLAPYAEAHQNLQKLSGVGAKVADCVCLMSLDKHGAVPIDTHVRQMTAKLYMPKLANTKTVTDKLYREIGNFYRSKFGDYAGWAHDVIFIADLDQFANVMNTEKPTKKNTGIRVKARKLT